jgi:peptidoglycan/LPS O-acetylase OafA/YrhL
MQTKYFTYRKDIQAMRGISVLSVLLYHSQPRLFPNGYIGVDIFFVVSGFLMTPLMLQIVTKNILPHERLLNLCKFFKKRFYRLAPAASIIFIFSLIALILFAPISDHKKILNLGLTIIFLIGNIGASEFSGDYFLTNANPLTHFWSLAVEVHFYLIFPLIFILAFPRKIPRQRVITYILIVISFISMVFFFKPIILQPLYDLIGINNKTFYYYSTFNRVWQFSLGGLAYIFLDKFKKSLKVSIVLNYILAVILMALILTPNSFGYKFASLLATSLALLMILLKSCEVFPYTLAHKLIWLGNRSYSIYLIHLPLVYLARYSPFFEINGLSTRGLQVFCSVLISVGLGSISYNFIESKFELHKIQNLIGNRSFMKSVIFFVVPPFLFLQILNIGVNNKYWGFDKNITPPPYAADLDPKCERESLDGPPCKYNYYPDLKSVLLIGDSHAGQLSQAVIDAAQQKGWGTIIWTHGNCPIQFKKYSNDAITNECLQANLRTLDWIIDTPPDLIIISQYTRAKYSQRALQEALAKIRNISSNIIFIENFPIFPDGEDFMIAKPLVMKAYNPPKWFPESKMMKEDLHYSKILAEYARNIGIRIVNFKSVFCEIEVCARFSNGKWLYRDDDHLSVYGASLIIPFLVNQMASN